MYWCTLSEDDQQSVGTCRNYSSLIAESVYCNMMHLLVLT
jgi:hypothetical protein